jgi:hypothetical protein
MTILVASSIWTTVTEPSARFSETLSCFTFTSREPSGVLVEPVKGLRVLGTVEYGA